MIYTCKQFKLTCFNHIETWPTYNIMCCSKVHEYLACLEISLHYYCKLNNNISIVVLKLVNVDFFNQLENRKVLFVLSLIYIGMITGTTDMFATSCWTQLRGILR